MYLKGKGVAQDKSMAMNWYRKAAEQGNINVQYNIGVLYEQGKGGLHQSDALAVEWYRKAAEQGHANAQNNLGFMHKQGKCGLHQSDALAVEWYRKSAEQGVARNYPAAMKWYQMAADQGYADAQYNLRLMYKQGKGELLRLERIADNDCIANRTRKKLKKK